MTFSSFLQSIIYVWLDITAKKRDTTKQPYLDGPIADGREVGDMFYNAIAENEHLTATLSSDAGLLPDFTTVLNTNSPHLSQLDSEIATFYEHTARYKMDVWSKWLTPISWFAKLLIRVISVDMKQMNLPLDSIETSYGMSSEVIQLLDSDGNQKYACWLRKTNKENKVVYAGFYSAFEVLGSSQRFVRVVFPLPKGNVTVMLQVEIQADGSVKLLSNKSLKHTGYYRVHKTKRGIFKVQKIPINEIIHVFRDEVGKLRTDHYFAWWKVTFLHLHYKLKLDTK